MLQTQAQLARREHFRIEGVFHGDQDVHALAPRHQPDDARVQHAGDPVLHRVFHQRLQQQGWNGASLAGRLNVLVHPQALAETHVLHFKIAARQGQFLAQGKALAIAQSQAAAQEVRQPYAHFSGARAIQSGQRGNGMQAVEQEMRVELHAQGL